MSDNARKTTSHFNELRKVPFNPLSSPNQLIMFQLMYYLPVIQLKNIDK